MALYRQNLLFTWERGCFGSTEVLLNMAREAGLSIQRFEPFDVGQDGVVLEIELIEGQTGLNGGKEGKHGQCSVFSIQYSVFKFRSAKRLEDRR